MRELLFKKICSKKEKQTHIDSLASKKIQKITEDLALRSRQLRRVISSGQITEEQHENYVNTVYNYINQFRNDFHIEYNPSNQDLINQYWNITMNVENMVNVARRRITSNLR